MKTKTTQKQAILKEFKKGKTLNCLTAFKLIGTMKLATRVSEFKKEGYQFTKNKINFKTSYGTTGYYFNYKLINNGEAKK